MSCQAFVFKNGVELDVHWHDCELGSEDDELVFEYFGTVAGLIECGLPAECAEKMYSSRGRPKGMKIKNRVDRDGDRIQICTRSKSKVRIKVYKPLEHALRTEPFASWKNSSAASMLERFRRPPAKA